MKDIRPLALGICIAIGLIVVGVCINSGLQSFSNKERVVTVKGLAEKKIKATEANISILVASSSSNPKLLMSNIDSRLETLKDYLSKNGYSKISISDVSINDSKTDYEYEWEGDKRVKVKKDRYSANAHISVDIADIEKAELEKNKINNDLINLNLSSDVTCNYIFPELNSIKPQLIAESTKNARLAGEKFANDSQSQLGKIKTASQGQISIVGKYHYDDESFNTLDLPEYMQKIRVVSTIVFFLED